MPTHEMFFNPVVLRMLSIVTGGAHVSWGSAGCPRLLPATEALWDGSRTKIWNNWSSNPVPPIGSSGSRLRVRLVAAASAETSRHGFTPTPEQREEGC